MTTTITKPTLFYIQHPLGDKNLSDQTLATFSDSDLAEYRSEFEEYRTAQHTAVSDMHDHAHQTRAYFSVLFGNDSKQCKYLERSINNGELLTDKHATNYPSPSTVENGVKEARQKYCSFMSDANAPKISGDDTLQEINNATTYLMDAGLSLNEDFTISNAVSLAQSIASEKFDDSLNVSGSDYESHYQEAVQYNITLSGGVEFDASKYSVSDDNGWIKLRYDSDDDEDKKVKDARSTYLSYKVSFKEMKNRMPMIELCSGE